MGTEEEIEKVILGKENLVQHHESSIAGWHGMSSRHVNRSYPNASKQGIRPWECKCILKGGVDTPFLLHAMNIHLVQAWPGETKGSKGGRARGPVPWHSQSTGL